MMQRANFDDGFSKIAMSMINAVAKSSPQTLTSPDPGSRDVLRYLSGVLPADEAALIEQFAIDAPKLRRELGDLISVLSEFQAQPYSELVLRLASNPEGSPGLSAWIEIVDSHIKTVTTFLAGCVPVTWPAIAAMAKQGAEGLIAARTMWRALFADSPALTGRPPLQLGFGYRRGIRGAIEPVQLFTQLEGVVLPNGDLQIEASTDFGPAERAVFFAFSMNGRALPLAEATVQKGRVQVVVEGLGQFLRLSTGPIPEKTLAARLDDWPEVCKLGHVIVHSGVNAFPVLDLPVISSGHLVLTGVFEEPQLDGKWELLVAVSPNCWQMLAEFDIKCVFERPQVLRAAMPSTAMEGPFGGALWFRRQKSKAN